MNTFEAGEFVSVVDNRTGESESWQVVRLVDTYVEDCNYFPEIYLLKQTTVYMDGRIEIIADVFNSVRIRKIK